MNWISVEERLPEVGQHVVAARICGNGVQMILCTYLEHGFPLAIFGSNNRVVDYWYPVPPIKQMNPNINSIAG